MFICFFLLWCKNWGTTRCIGAKTGSVLQPTAQPKPNPNPLLKSWSTPHTYFHTIAFPPQKPHWLHPHPRLQPIIVPPFLHPPLAKESTSAPIPLPHPAPPPPTAPHTLTRLRPLVRVSPWRENTIVHQLPRYPQSITSILRRRLPTRSFPTPSLGPAFPHRGGLHPCFNLPDHSHTSIPLLFHPLALAGRQYHRRCADTFTVMKVRAHCGVSLLHRLVNI